MPSYPTKSEQASASIRAIPNKYTLLSAPFFPILTWYTFLLNICLRRTKNIKANCK